MKAWRKRVTNWMAIRFMRGLSAWLRRKPVMEAYRFGEWIGRMIPKFQPARMRKALENLELAFPEMPESERADLARKTFEHFGRAAVDFLVSPDRTIEDIEATTEIASLDRLDAAMAKGKGVIMVSGHLGNWERYSAWLSMKGYPVTVIARDANQGDVNQMVNEIRSRSGTKVLARGNAARATLSALKGNGLVAILADQNASEVFVPFFGHLAGSALGPGVLAARTGATVLPGYCVYIGDGRWKFVVGDPIEEEPGFETKGEGMMRAIHAWLEGEIREYPEQWLWFHDRWRSARERGYLNK